jgi:hypothetical protein
MKNQKEKKSCGPGSADQYESFTVHVTKKDAKILRSISAFGNVPVEAVLAGMVLQDCDCARNEPREWFVEDAKLAMENIAPLSSLARIPRRREKQAA